MSVNCIVNQTGRLSDPTKKLRLEEPLAYSNNRAHAMRFTVVSEDSDEPADLTGVGVTGQFIRYGSNPVDTVSPINGTVTGNVCEVILPASCYAVPGRYRFTMDIAVSGDNPENRTVLWVEGIVERNTTEAVVDPGTPVPNITAAINNANAAAEDANSAAEAARQAAQEATGAVSYETQTGQTDAQKEQARDNIGAAGAGEVSDLKNQITPYHEDSMVATRDYVFGDILMVGSTIYKTKRNIATGTELTSTYVSEITLREYFSGTGQASGNLSHAEGDAARATANAAHAEGYKTIAGANYSHTEGSETKVTTGTAHAEGVKSQANGNGAHAEGLEAEASASGSHAEGYKSKSTALYSHAEGRETTASAANAHAEGKSTVASSSESHAEGSNTTASGSSSHAEGGYTIASGSAAHAEGITTVASGDGSHSEGIGCEAVGEHSHAEGYYNKASHAYQHVFGRSNAYDPSQNPSSVEGTYIEIVGNGEGGNRSNARTLDWSGNEALAGSLTLGKGTADEVTITAAQLTQLLALLN